MRKASTIKATMYEKAGKLNAIFDGVLKNIEFTHAPSCTPLGPSLHKYSCRDSGPRVIFFFLCKPDASES